VFRRKLKLERNGVPGTDYYKILFNANCAHLLVGKSSGRNVDMGNDLSEAVLCTSNSLPISFSPPVGSRIRDIELIFHRNWADKHIPREIPEQAEMIRRMKSGEKVQFTATIDLNSLDIINKMLEVKMDSPAATLHMEGLVLQLFSTFVKNIIEEHIGERYIYNDDYERIVKFVEKQEQNLDLKLPSLEEAAIECNMGRSKFVFLFTTFYKESYGNFFIKMRLQKAYEMLQEERSVTDVVHSVGYSNIGNFIKSFKALYGISPKQAQKAARIKNRKARFKNNNDKM
jgi:AraC-like DNA-binding protein